MQRDAIRVEEELLESVDAIQTERFLNAIGQIWIVEADIESKGFGSQCHCTADATESDDA